MRKILILSQLLLVFYCYSQPFQNDLGITQLLQPCSSGSLTSTEHIMIKINNSGTDPQGNFCVQYTVNGAAPVIEVCPVTIQPGTEIMYTFVSNTDLSSYGTSVALFL